MSIMMSMCASCWVSARAYQCYGHELDGRVNTHALAHPLGDLVALIMLGELAC